MPRVALLTIGDGRDHLLARTTASLYEHVAPPEAWATHVHVDDRAHRLGFAGAIRRGWEILRALEGFEYVFHLEEDWLFDRDVDLAGMARLLREYPALAQVALRRNAVNAQERLAGGVVEMWPDEYLEKALTTVVLSDGTVGRIEWLEHGLYFTTNPCLYPVELIEHRLWPDTPGSEAAFTAELLRLGYRFALWGPRKGTWVTHTGHDRTGVGY